MTDLRRGALFLGVLLAFSQIGALRADQVRLKSGTEVEIIDGQIPEKVIEELYIESQELLRERRLDLARDIWRFLLERAKGDIVRRVREAREQAKEIEYGSLLLLANGRIFKGKVSADLRTDLLGLERKVRIPTWQVEEIVAEYHLGNSQVTKTFYPITLLEIKLHNQELQTARMSGEIEFRVEAGDGSIFRGVLGIPYGLIRPENLRAQMDEMIQDRIVKVVIYAELRTIE